MLCGTCPPLQICQNLFMRGLSLVGWYHSHPRGPALPSLQDIDSQMDHQLKLQGSNNGFQPCLGIICGRSALAVPPRADGAASVHRSVPQVPITTAIKASPPQ